MWTKEPDGSIIDAAGNVVWFSCRRFIADIVEGDCCFICGAAPGTKPFNAEHVLPDWLLSRFGLHSQSLSLGNGAKVLYGKLKVPCCSECNSLMGQRVEARISKVVRSGTKATLDFTANGGLLEFYVWMGLIFLKLHLKDRTFRYHLDSRKGSEKLSDFYVWEQLHHLYSVVRCFANGAHVEQEAVGSFLTMPVHLGIKSGRFDLADLPHGQAMLLTMDDMAYFAVFNDAGGAWNGYHPILDKIPGPISKPQSREILAELAFVNLQMKERPEFVSLFDMQREKYSIKAVRPREFELAQPLDMLLRGEFLQHTLGDFLEQATFVGTPREEVLEAARLGNLSILFDNDGHFIGPTNFGLGP